MSEITTFLYSKKYFILILTAFGSLSIAYFDIPLIGWMVYGPLWVLVFSAAKLKNAAILGFIYGLALGVFLMFWAVDALAVYTDNLLFGWLSYFVGIVLYAIIYSVLFSMQFTIGKIFRQKAIISLLLMGLFACLYEMVLEYLFSGMPYLIYYSGYSVLHEYLILQWSSIGGIYLISFLVLGSNALFAYYLLFKEWKILLYQGICIITIYLGGWWIVNDFESRLVIEGELNVAILSENTDPTIKWSDATAPKLINTLFHGLEKAVAYQPDVVLWSESAIPWTYDPEDDFIKSVKAKSNDIPQLIGINTGIGKNKLYNSAYLLNANVSNIQRYDKNYLLSFVESPLWGIDIPIFGTEHFEAVSGRNIKPFVMNDASIGVMICNETNISKVSDVLVTQGAQVLVALSNDGWFRNSELIKKFHFMQARLRAVEQRKDFVVNANCGYSGKISANGKIDIQEVRESLNVFSVNINLNNFNTIYQKL